MKYKKWLSPVLSVAMVMSCVCSAEAAEAEPVAVLRYGQQVENFTEFAKGWNAAVTAAASAKDAELTLLGDWKADKNGSFGTGKGFQDGALYWNAANALTLDLNGHTVDRGLTAPRDDGAVLYVNSDLTVTDTNPKAANAFGLLSGGTITGGANTEDGGGIVVADGAAFTLNGGAVVNCISEGDGGGIFADGEHAKVKVIGGTLFGNRAVDGSGGAVCCEDGTVILNKALFEGNYAEDEGGAVYMDDGTLKATDSRFYGNSTAEEGGAVYMDDGANTDLENCIFTHNRAENGGACYIDSDDGTYLKNCSMVADSASEKGGAVFSEGDRVFLMGGEYRLNTAGQNGGGIYVDSMYDVNIAGKLVVADNTVNKKGNNLCLQNGNFSEAYLYCGGLYDGSAVYLCSTDKDSRLAVVNIDTYQYKNYIRFDSGFQQDRVEAHSQSQAGVRAEGSALGDGNVLTVALLTALVAVMAVAMIIYAKKRKKGAVRDDEDS